MLSSGKRVAEYVLLTVFAALSAYLVVSAVSGAVQEVFGRVIQVLQM